MIPIFSVPGATAAFRRAGRVRRRRRQITFATRAMVINRIDLRSAECLPWLGAFIRARPALWAEAFGEA